MVSPLARWPVILLVGLFCPALSFSQDMRQLPDAKGGVRTLPLRPPAPEGQRVTVNDGDTVVIEGDARVRVVRRRPAFVRLIADAERRFAIVITELLNASGDTPLRLSDKAYTFHSVEGQWSLPARWEGHAWMEEEASFDGFGLGGLGVETPAGTIVFGRRGSYEGSRSAVQGTSLTYMGFSTSGGGMGGSRRPFDDVEHHELANALRSESQNGVATTGGSNGFSSFSFGSGGIGISSEVVTRERIPPAPAPDGAVRVGGHIPAPRKVQHVDPVTPEQARAAGVVGTVILEITIGIDGAVQDARILRSIPMLDQPALDAVRQWRYEPLLMNGVATPAIMTATVSFGDQR